jgi:Putative Flp pilus-assembly TadE/G-like
MTFAVAILPILAGAGVAVDFARIATKHTNLQQATDVAYAGGASNYEIALVLDNSGSMNESVSGNSKIAALRTAATNFINTMFNGPFTGKVKMSIVPFAGLVSLSSNDTSNGSASWIDTQGKPSWHWKTFKNHSTVGFTNRLDIFKNLKAVNSDWAWAGCFETQPYPQNVNDTPPTSATPDTHPSKRVPSGTARPHRPIRTTTSIRLRRAAAPAPLRRRTTSR